MLELLWLIPALPLVGFLALVCLKPAKSLTALVGVGSVGLSAAAAFFVGARFLSSPPPGHTYRQTLWTWIRLDGLDAGFSLYLDPLALVMVLVITGVGLLIHLYSAEHMIEDKGYRRFFAYMNLFVGSMLILVLADNLLLLYLGWEGVGLCSYLLIGFWYENPSNGRAARKAFIVTRVGDTALAVALFLIYRHLGTLEIQRVMAQASIEWPVGSNLALAAAALLLAGAVGKSAQLPLQTWLPDAMAGPSPVSALIHAATMVTAGVYLIARTHVLFALAPAIQAAVAVIGAATLLVAGSSALVQRDIKRVLAYSTISQIGYMFVALGVGAWAAALFHFMTHAFFKALLFLAAGVVIQALHEEHDMLKMGGLRRQMPLVFLTFLAGSASLAALPVITAGFYSKEWILWAAWSSQQGSPWLWAAGLAGALLTSGYTFRMVFLTFFGPTRPREIAQPGLRVQVPLVLLAVLSVIGGWLELPGPMGNVHFFSDFLWGSLPAPSHLHGSPSTELFLEAVAAVASLAGIVLAYWFFLRRPGGTEALVRSFLGGILNRFWLAGWAFDWLYDRLLVRPYVWLAEKDRDDFFDQIYRGLAWLNRASYQGLSLTQNGQVRWYAMGMAVGAAIVLAMVVFL
jgi:NADH-quinone oxidoreductase subunit L